MLEIKGLKKKIGKKWILNGVDISIPKNTIVGFIGPNGAGKTTTMKIASGLAKFDEGEIFVDDLSIRKNYEEYMTKIGAAFNCNSFYGKYTAVENMELFCCLNKISINSINEMLDIVGLTKRRNTAVETYSLGMKQRLNMAMALVKSPDMCFLDEPFNGIDPKGVYELRELIIKLRKEMGTSFLISSHNLSEIAKISDLNYYIKKGKIIEKEEGINNKTFLVIKVEKVDDMRAVLENNKVKYSLQDNKYFVIIEKSKLDGIIRELVDKKVNILDITLDNVFEGRYIQMMGGDIIE